ncbi:MAG TPA: chromosome segregation protein SMC [Bacillota bacterium]|nr:chromosome segregation protein SMC [Bacillota bacterium]
MYLKRLEILGFKSFADKIRLDFLPGVTGVVGPNGSGKSNISDALRWVLGEQSVKNLRGLKMDDVIFAGTQARKPLGLAEVTIVLDNSDGSIPLDFTEISVTRKLFRSGESEYLINKSPVRLRDVLELFYDTGLGKEAYSIIGQGKIDSILSVKAEERRIIFEEAAGIIKYKTRKQIAERKLSETDQNLLRLQDIITEIEGQLGPLQSQAVLAKQYLGLKEQLTVLEINYYGKLITELQIQLDSACRSKQELDQNYGDFEGGERIIDAEIEEKRLNLLDQDNQITKENEEFYRIQNQIEKSAEQINFLNEKLADLAEQESNRQNEQANNSKRKQAILEEQATLDQEIDQVKFTQADHETELGRREGELSNLSEQLATFEAQEQNVKNELIDLLNEIASLKNKVNSTTLQKDFISRQAADFQKKVSSLQNQLIQFQQEFQTKTDSLQATDIEITERHQTQGELARKIIHLEEEFSSIEIKNLDWKERLRGLESKITLLEEMERSYQGYFQGVKAVLAETEREPFYRSIRGIVADLIKVQPGMELAVETALGSSLQHIVIENDQYAQEAIGYLKKTNKGRATFLPLNLIQNHGYEAKLLQYQQVLHQHGCQSAISLLHFAPEYHHILNYLLNLTIVAPDLKTAVKVSSKLEKSFRIVTPEGDLVNPGGSITGGSIDKRRLGLLSRRKEIEDFKKEKSDSEAFLEKGLQNARNLKNEIQNATRELELAKKLENEARLRKVSLEREQHGIEQNSRQIREEIGIYENQLKELEAESEKFEVNKEEFTELIKTGEASLQDLESKVADLAAAIHNARKRKEEVSGEVSELKSLLSAGRQQESGKITLKERLLRQIAELDLQIGELKSKEEQIEAEQGRIRDTIESVTQKIESDKVRLQEQERVLGSSKVAKEQIMVQIKELENRQRSFRRKHNDFQNQIHKLELTINQKKLEIENCQSNLTDDYGFEWLDKANPNWVAPEDTLQRIEQFKGELRDLGTVNLAAIDDYAQLKQRHDFLADQFQDLMKAKESLLKVISEIEQTIVKRFEIAFEQIKVEFKRIFGELFEGGSSDLFLIDPTNPLESGIEIVAQPPGKKLQSLSLLSGGERAMTAIALLFSILAVKPAPFCILDEIDAALDEMNVSRFSRLLELFSKHLQFIVVTHRRSTMEAANALYGVTMEEQGVSKLISLDISQQRAG